MSGRRSAYADQAKAATREAKQIASHWATLAGAEHRPGLANPTSTRLVRELNMRITAGLPVCRHLTGGPGVGFWVAWKPERMRCARCAHDVLAATRGTREDGRCDGCGQVVDLIHPTLLQGGSVVAILGLCGDCEAGR